MGSLLSSLLSTSDTNDGMNQSCNIMKKHEIDSIYSKLSISFASKAYKNLKTTTNAKEIHTILLKTSKHSHFKAKEIEIPFGRLSRANSIDSLHLDSLSTEEELVKELNGRCDHDTNEFFQAILAYEKIFKGHDEFCHGLAHYKRAVKLWTNYLATTGQQLDLIPKLLTSKAGVTAAKYAYRNSSLDSRLIQVGMAKVLEEGTPFYLQTFSHMIDLLEKQRHWDEVLLCKSATDTKQPSLFIDRSIIESIRHLVGLAPFFDENLLVEAVQLAQSFNIHPSQFWWATLQVCLDTNQCELFLWMYRQVERSPLNRREVVEAFIDAKRFELAKQVADCERNNAAKARLLVLVQRAQSSRQPDEEPTPISHRMSVKVEGSI